MGGKVTNRKCIECNMENLIKKLARGILRQEIADFKSRIVTLEDDRALLIEQCHERQDSIDAMTKEIAELRKRISHPWVHVLPVGLVSKVMLQMPNPNSIGTFAQNEMREKSYIIQGQGGKMHEEDKWYFEVRFESIDVITDNRVELTISLRNNLGQQKIKIPATKATLKSEKLKATTWVWNLQESDLLVLPDDLYAVLYKASEAWTNICAEMHI